MEVLQIGNYLPYEFLADTNKNYMEFTFYIMTRSLKALFPSQEGINKNGSVSWRYTPVFIFVMS